MEKDGGPMTGSLAEILIPVLRGEQGGEVIDVLLLVLWNCAQEAAGVISSCPYPTIRRRMIWELCLRCLRVLLMGDLDRPGCSAPEIYVAEKWILLGANCVGVFVIGIGCGRVRGKLSEIFMFVLTICHCLTPNLMG